MIQNYQLAPSTPFACEVVASLFKYRTLPMQILKLGPSANTAVPSNGTARYVPALGTEQCVPSSVSSQEIDNLTVLNQIH